MVRQEPLDRECIRVLDPQGEFVSGVQPGLDIGTPERWLSWYRAMVIARAVDLQATALQRQGELGLWASCLGQEAAQIGAGTAMAAQDYAFVTYREHGIAWSRGIDPVDSLRSFRGVSLAGWDPQHFRVSVPSIVIGTQVVHAVGYAMGVQRDQQVATGDAGVDTAVLACFGDGATSEGDVHEAFVWAAVTGAPVVFFCQNNQWAISEPVTRQSPVPLFRRAAGYGFPGEQVDGNDILATYAVVSRALDRARSGLGPSLIEAVTYRRAAHTTSDDPTRYRDSSEDDFWRARDPIDRLRILLRAQGVLDDPHAEAIDAEAEIEAGRVRRGCLALVDPPPESIFDHVYSAPHSLVDAQRRLFLDPESGVGHV